MIKRVIILFFLLTLFIFCCNCNKETKEEEKTTNLLSEKGISIGVEALISDEEDDTDTIILCPTPEHIKKSLDTRVDLMEAIKGQIYLKPYTKIVVIGVDKYKIDLDADFSMEQEFIKVKVAEVENSGQVGWLLNSSILKFTPVK